mgnify:CR=1 FL=1|jgi:hypothetical protein
MRRVYLVLVLGLLSVSPGLAQRTTTFEALTVSTASVGITSTTLRPAGQALENDYCSLYVSVANIRYRFDGTAPTTSVGVIAGNGDMITIDNSEQARAIRFIRDDAADATLEIHCWRQPSS